MKAIIISIALCLGMGGATYAQQQQYQHPDLAPVTNYDPLDVLAEWEDWKQNPTAANAYVSAFMQQYNVPQSGVQNLSRKETWYMWISNHATEIQAYFQMKQAANSQ